MFWVATKEAFQYKAPSSRTLFLLLPPYPRLEDLLQHIPNEDFPRDGDLPTLPLVVVVTLNHEVVIEVGLLSTNMELGQRTECGPRSVIPNGIRVLQRLRFLIEKYLHWSFLHISSRRQPYQFRDLAIFPMVHGRLQ